MVYDGVITKPELTEENMLMHWGVKGMKWKKRKAAIKNKLVGFNRKIRGYKPSDVTTNYGKKRIKKGGYGFFDEENMHDNWSTMMNKIYYANKKNQGTANSLTGGEGSRVDAGISAGRQRALEKALKNRKNRPGSRKKKVISGTTSVKKRGKA